MTNVSDERRGSGLRAWSTRNLLVVAALGVALGLALVPLLYAEAFLMAALGPAGATLMLGLYVIPFLMAAYITRRPGAALFGSVIVGLVWTPLSPAGWVALVAAIVVGMACEVPFLVTRYRHFSLPMLLIAGAVAGLLQVGFGYVAFGFSNLTLGAQLALIFGTAVSGAILGGLLAKLLSDALAKTGVLSAYPAGRQRREEV